MNNKMKLQLEVSDMILGLVREALDGDLAEVSNGDIQAITEALAQNIITKITIALHA